MTTDKTSTAPVMLNEDRLVAVRYRDLHDLLDANLAAADQALALTGGIDFIEEHGGPESDDPMDRVAYSLFYGLFPAKRLRDQADLNATTPDVVGGDVVEAEPGLVAGRLPTYNQDEYPGLHEWWVQVWESRDEDSKVFARAYGNTPEQASERAKRIVAALDAPRVQRDADVHSLIEASRCLGVAQAKSDAGAVAHWDAEVKRIVADLAAQPKGDSVSGPMLTSAQGIEFSIRHPAEQTRGDGVRGEMAIKLQERNRHIDIVQARYYVDAVCDLLPRQAVPDELIVDLRKFHEESEACDEFDLPHEATAALLAANLIEGTHFVLTAKGEALLAAPSAGRMGVES